MKRSLSIALLSLLLPMLLWCEPGISVLPEVGQGEVLRVLVWDRTPLTVSGTLSLEGRRAARGEGFAVETGDEEIFCRLILLPLASTQSPGTAVLTLNGRSGEIPFSLDREIRIAGREFIREDIPLSTAMSDLRQSDDPEKARQSQALSDILLTVNPDHVFHQGPFRYPMEGSPKRTSFYGDRRRFLYTDGKEASSVHFGIDFSGNPGTPVYSDGAGLVVFSGFRILTGNTVVVEHLPGVYSLYYHMTRRDVAQGDRVETGTPVGTVGSTGLVTGAHLHWEIRVNGVPVAPDPLVSAGLLDKEQILGIVKGR